MTSLHWDNAYASKSVHERSWSESGDSDALAELFASGISNEDAIIDIGGGSSTFVDSLLSTSYSNISVLDISSAAISEAKHRTGLIGESVSWMVGDVLAWNPPNTYRYWNDRAVFHFFVDPLDQQKYVQKVRDATSSGSHIVIATFSPEGPESCSGLPVQRWSAHQLLSLFADFCTVVSHTDYKHVTPWGSSQSFMRLHVKRN
jgi:hypothetical protein